MVNYSLIIEYHQKGNNNTQVAPPPKQTFRPATGPFFYPGNRRTQVAASKANASHDRAALCGFRPKLPGGAFRAGSARRLPAIKNDQVNCVSSGRETVNLPFSRTSSEEAQT